MSAVEPTTMGEVEALIHERGAELTSHPFIQRLDGPASYAEFAALLPRLGFFVFAFQDVLRLSGRRATDPELHRLIESMERGDRGHEQWYLEDLQALGIQLRVEDLFSREYEVTRDVAYELVGRVELASDDFSRLALILCLEEAAQQFFGRVSGYAKRAGVTRRLRYFGGEHLLAEESHEVFEDAGQKQLEGLVVAPAARAAVAGAIERTFHAMKRLADDLHHAMISVAESPGNGVRS
ncbi:MAG: iron-containing redox enzyme family protein [Myxococcota bacterium]|nr:iron-containing redox enzyme family protein [Myxococcota bacterium]